MRYSSLSDTVHKIGHWSQDSTSQKVASINNNNNQDDSEYFDERTLGSGLSILNDSLIEDNVTEVITLTVVTKEESPYVMLNPGKTGNDAFDGFAIDLLKVKGRALFFFNAPLSKLTGQKHINLEIGATQVAFYKRREKTPR